MGRSRTRHRHVRRKHIHHVRRCRWPECYFVATIRDSACTASLRQRSPSFAVGGVWNLKWGDDCQYQMYVYTVVSGSLGVPLLNITGSSCASWSGGSMSFTDTAAPWIWAQKAGSAISSDAQTATLTQHDSSNTFTVDLTKAAGGNSLNPFAQSVTTGTNPSSTSAPLTVSTSGSTVSGSGSAASLEMKRHAHGFLMAIAFLYVLYGCSWLNLLTVAGYSSPLARSLYVCYHSRASSGYMLDYRCSLMLLPSQEWALAFGSL